MSVDRMGDARRVVELLESELPTGWIAEARDGLYVGTELDLLGGRWVVVHWRRPGRWVYLPERLVLWMMYDDNYDLWQEWFTPPTDSTMIVGPSRFARAAEGLLTLVRMYESSTL